MRCDKDVSSGEALQGDASCRGSDDAEMRFDALHGAGLRVRSRTPDDEMALHRCAMHCVALAFMVDVPAVAVRHDT